MKFVDPCHQSLQTAWINAYNAGAIKTVLTDYPIGRVLEVKNPALLFFLSDKAGFFIDFNRTFLFNADDMHPLFYPRLPNESYSKNVPTHFRPKRIPAILEIHRLLTHCLEIRRAGDGFRLPAYGAKAAIFFRSDSFLFVILDDPNFSTF